LRQRPDSRAVAATQCGADLLASAVAGVLWTTVSPAVAFLYARAFMLLALTVFPKEPNRT